MLLLLSHFSHVRLCDPTDGSPPGSPVPGILQAGTPEWAAISFSNAWKWKVKVKSLSRVRLPATPWTTAHQAPPSMGFSRQEYWSGAPLPSPELPYDSAMPLLSIYPEKTIIQNNAYSLVFTGALFTIARKQPKCPPTKEQIKKTWNINTLEYYSAKKEKSWVISSEVDEPRCCYIQWSKSECIYVESRKIV